MEIEDDFISNDTRYLLEQQFEYNIRAILSKLQVYLLSIVH